MPTKTNELLLTSGLSEVALGALTGWRYALAIANNGRTLTCTRGIVEGLRVGHLTMRRLKLEVCALAVVVPPFAARGVLGYEGVTTP